MEQSKKHRVLLLDSDETFNHITAKVLRKAGFHMVPCLDIESARSHFLESEGNIDLVVLSKEVGLEIIPAFRAIKNQLPFIVLAKDWEKKTINEYITLGVAGIYKKPINLFAMIDRMKELLFVSSGASNSFSWMDETMKGWRPTCCGGKSPRMQEFVKKLWRNKDYKKHLVIEAPKDAPWKLVVDDLRSASPQANDFWEICSANEMSSSFFEQMVSRYDGKEETSRLTIALVDAADLSPAQQNDLCDFMITCDAQEKKSFHLRFLFFTSVNFDEAYDAGNLNDRFYMSSGSLFLKYPDLPSCPEEKEFFLRFYLEQLAGKEGLEDWSIISLSEKNLRVNELVDPSFSDVEAHAKKLFDSLLVNLHDTECEIIEGYPEYLQAYFQNFASEWIEIVSQIFEDKSEVLDSLSISEEDFILLKNRD